MNVFHILTRCFHRRIWKYIRWHVTHQSEISRCKKQILLISDCVLSNEISFPTSLLIRLRWRTTQRSVDDSESILFTQVINANSGSIRPTDQITTSKSEPSGQSLQCESTSVIYPNKADIFIWMTVDVEAFGGHDARVLVSVSKYSMLE